MIDSMIKGFNCKHTKQLYEGECPKKFKAFQCQAERRLQMLDDAVELLDLRSPPSNRFEALGGDRKGQYSISINKQWRVCFEWNDAPFNVEIVDYH